MLDYITSYLSSNTTPGQAGNVFWATVYILVIFGYSFWMAQTVKSFTGGAELTTNNFGIGALLSTVSIILVLGAAKAIQRDENLVKSADRLR